MFGVFFFFWDSLTALMVVHRYDDNNINTSTITTATSLPCTFGSPPRSALLFMYETWTTYGFLFDLSVTRIFSTRLRPCDRIEGVPRGCCTATAWLTTRQHLPSKASSALISIPGEVPEQEDQKSSLGTSIYSCYLGNSIIWPGPPSPPLQLALGAN